MKYRQNWKARAIRPDGASEWFDAKVPGNVQHDYGVHMGWGDVNFADNADLYRETEGYTWEYRTELSFEKKAGERAVLTLEGVDYLFDVLIDGKTVLSHEGMFTKTEADVSDAEGREVIVRIHPHPKRADAIPSDRSEADESVKPPVCYGWDWHPRLLVSGIWQDAYVETRGAGYIASVEPFYTLSEDFSKASVRFESVSEKPVRIRLYDPDGALIGEGDTFEIDQPRLWWCAGQGKQELYSYTAETEDDSVSGTIGFRRVRLVMNEGAWKEPAGFPKSRSAAPAQIELNGRRVFAKGSNWVSPEIFEGLTDEKRYEELICAARDANMNIFRCWGGSGISKKPFYDLCDRYGIMLWVEFPLACNNYIGKANYLRVLEQEASAIIRMLRSHPAVVLYCGGNELFNSWSSMTEQSLPLRLLDKLCYELDRDKPFVMTSPLNGMAHGGYTFYDPAADKDVFSLFQQSSNTAYTEFGVPGVTEREFLEKIIPEEELFPIHRTKSWLIHHAFEAWGEERWLCMDVLEKYASGPLDTLDKVIAQAKWLQCEGYKAVFEEARRQAPLCGMAINWCYNEPWITAAGNSLIGYPAHKKPCYFAVKDALRPVMPSARIPKFDWKEGECFRAEIWLLNDAPASCRENVHVSVVIGGEEQLLFSWDTGLIDENTNKIGPSVNWVIPQTDADRFTLILKTDSEIRSEYTLCLRNEHAKRISRQLNV